MYICISFLLLLKLSIIFVFISNLCRTSFLEWRKLQTSCYFSYKLILIGVVALFLFKKRKKKTLQYTISNFGIWEQWSQATKIFINLIYRSFHVQYLKWNKSFSSQMKDLKILCPVWCLLSPFLLFPNKLMVCVLSIYIY